jgi:tetratricopeptide (TPR) repeat protein
MKVTDEQRQKLLSDAIERHRRGRFLEAERIYRRILQSDPGHPDALHLLGLIAKQAGQTEAAIQLLQQAIANSPNTPSFRANLAIMFEEEGRYTDSEMAARGALALDPRNGSALHCLANALRAGDRYREAAEAYDQAVREITDDPLLWSNYGVTLRRLGRNEEAIAVLRRALTLSPGQGEMHSNLGNALLASGHFDQAVAAFRDAMRVDPGFSPAYTNLANAYLQTGQAQQAAEVLEHCLEVSPGNRKGLAFMAAAANEIGDDETRDRLLDFDRFMTSRRWQAPEGYASLEEFNAALTKHAVDHASLQWEPVTKTTRSGSQTGELLDEDPGPIAALEGMIREAVQAYLEALPEDEDHPFVATRPDEWKLTLWATVLDQEGHQAAHLHPTGWLSGVYYAAVPPTRDGSEHAGWIEFGRPPDDFRLDTPPQTRLFQPEPGLMLLFPSYFYHRTVPFQGAGKRVSIAFDIMPSDASGVGVLQTGGLSRQEIESKAGRVQQLLQAGQAVEAEAAARQLFEAVPEDPTACYLLGLSVHRLGQVEEARGLLAKACELEPGHARYRLDLGTCYQQLGDEQKAAENFEAAADLDPASIEAFMRLATLYSDRGRFDEARDAYERAIARQPAASGAYYGLATLKRFTPGDPQIGRMRALLESPDLPTGDEAVVCFALGRALDQIDDLDSAMQSYARGNRLKRELTDFDIHAEESNSERIIEAFNADLFEKFEGLGDPSDLPVFIVGMPRSGTTLVEQILDSHPAIFGAGELNDLWRIVNGIGRWLPAGSSLPTDVGKLDPAAWADLGTRFVRRLQRYDREASRIVDKLPFNYTLAGIIRLMLPNARIIHCVRDPRDTCLSCYLTSFQNDRGFTCDLADLGSTYSIYWRLMDHWRTVLPGGFHEVRYEQLVEDTEAQTRSLIDYLGVDWSDDCMRFFDNPRMVTTASMTQVRQPVYRSSIGRWRRYQEYLGPLLEKLGDVRQYGVEED